MPKSEHPVDLDRLFAEAKAEGAPEMSMALMANILGDAAEITAARATPAPAPAPALAPAPAPTWRGRLRALLAPIGGLPTLAALAASVLVGISAGYSGTDTLESLPGMGTLVSGISDDPLDDLGFGYTDAFSDFLAEG